MTVHADDWLYDIYEMPDGTWGGSVCGIVFDGCRTREGAYARALCEFDAQIRELWEDAEQAQPNTALGAAVRSLPEGWKLYRDLTDGPLWLVEYDGVVRGEGATPEEAIGDCLDAQKGARNVGLG